MIRYTRIEDKKTGTTTTHRTEIVPSGDGAALRVTDLATNAVVLEKPFIDPEDLAELCDFHDKTFPTIAACENEFACTCLPAVQCEVNQTCDAIFLERTCCVTGQPICQAALMVVRPNTPRCDLLNNLPDRGGFVFTQD